jgi:hypothetical protein
MNRRQFALASLPAAVLTGCHSATIRSRDATLLHNAAVRTAVADLTEAVNHLDERLTAFGPENWRDALAATQSTAIRLRADLDELKRALGYAESPEPTPANEHPQPS